MINYATQPNFSDFTFQHLSFKSEFEPNIFQDAFLQAEQKYGIVINRVREELLTLDTQRANYVLVSGAPFADPKRHKNKLIIEDITAKENAIVTCAFSYKKNEEYERRIAALLNRSGSTGARILYPDNNSIIAGEHRIHCSEQDIFNDLICQTRRAKFLAKANRDQIFEKQLEKFSNEYNQDIAKLQKLFSQYRLWHSAPTDGAVMIYDKDLGSFITQTKTSKNALSSDNFSLIQSFDAGVKGKDFYGELNYYGNKVPSSDSPELIVLQEAYIKQFPGIERRYFIHFHKNEITRNPAFVEKRTREELEYGIYDTGKDTFEYMQKQGIDSTNGNWLIWKEHGVIWIGESLQAFQKYLENVLD